MAAEEKRITAAWELIERDKVHRVDFPPFKFIASEYRCTNCQMRVSSKSEMPRRCPRCGAYMKGADDE